MEDLQALQHQPPKSHLSAVIIAALSILLLLSLGSVALLSVKLNEKKQQIALDSEIDKDKFASDRTLYVGAKITTAQIDAINERYSPAYAHLVTIAKTAAYDESIFTKDSYSSGEALLGDLDDAAFIALLSRFSSDSEGESSSYSPASQIDRFFSELFDTDHPRQFITKNSFSYDPAADSYITMLSIDRACQSAALITKIITIDTVSTVTLKSAVSCSLLRGTSDAIYENLDTQPTLEFTITDLGYGKIRIDSAKLTK